jgi:transposase
LLTEVSYLKERIVKLERENKSLKDELKQNSSNSHLPPSKDVQKPRKEIKPAFEKGHGKSNGGQIGHAGNTLEMQSKVDERVELRPSRCKCGMRMTGIKTYITETRQEQDIEINFIIRNYELHACICPRCNTEVKSEFPINIKAPVQYGAVLKSLICSLNIDCRVPVKKTTQLIEDISGRAINEATIINTCQQAFKLLETSEAEIIEVLNESKVSNVDETGVHVNKKTTWGHVMSNENVTYIQIHESRGQKAFGPLLKSYRGILVHDFYDSYFSLENAKHGMCNAHIIRELKFQTEDGKKWSDKLRGFLLEIKNQSIQKNKKNKKAIFRKYDRILNQGFEEEPPPYRNGNRGRLKSTKGRNLLNRLWTYHKEVLAFAFDKNIPFTNNQAERDIRPFKVKLKVAGCFRSFKGAKAYARIISFISTLRKNNINVFESLYTLFKYQGFSFYPPK